MKFYIVDAFSEEVFGGNPAGVVVLPEATPYPPDEIMVKTAVELRYSETIFIKKVSDDTFELRFFTPLTEVDLCGHGTIASFFAMGEEGLGSGSFTALTKAGRLNINIKNGLVMMDMAPPEAINRIVNKYELKKIYEAVGLMEEECKVSLEGEWDLFPEVISTGLPDIILPVKDKAALLKMKPDFEALAELSKSHGAVGLHAFALGEGLIDSECCLGSCDSSQVTAYCRNFAPLLGIDEEAATGTANGGLTYYLYRNKLIDEGIKCLFVQGESMGRRSIVRSEMNLNENGLEIQIGGYCATLVKGEIYPG